MFLTVLKRWSGMRNKRNGTAVNAACDFGHAWHRFVSPTLHLIHHPAFKKQHNLLAAG